MYEHDFSNRYEVVQRSEMSFAEIRDEADAIMKSFEVYGEVGMEDFGSDLKNAMIGLGNLAGHLTNNLKTLLFKFWKGVKRSELRYFNESNMVTMAQIKNMDFKDHAEAMMPIPSGMVGKYMPAIVAADNCLKALDIRRRAISFLGWVKQTDSKIRRSFFGSAKDVHFDAPAATQDFANIQKLQAVLGKHFETPNRPTMKLRELFTNHTELLACNDKLLTMEGYLNQVNGTVECADAISEIIDGTIKAIENGKINNMTSAQINELASIIRTMAVFFDLFADTLTVFNKIEHNFGQVLEELKTRLKK